MDEQLLKIFTEKMNYLYNQANLFMGFPQNDSTDADIDYLFQQADKINDFLTRNEMPLSVTTD